MKKKATDYPHWAYPSRHAFKAAKRRDARLADHALSELLFGCAYTPLRDVGVIREKMREYRRLLSVKAWGR